MKKTDVVKVKRIVQIELNKIAKKYKWYDKPVLDIVESEVEPNHWAVQVRTDADSYDYFYDYFAEKTSHKLQNEVMKTVDKKMKWKKGEHYFEPFGEGILNLY